MKKKPGPPSFDNLYGESFTDFKFKLTETQLAYLHKQAKKERIPVAQYLRRLIAQDMQRPS
jgi:hypothetical protein